MTLRATLKKVYVSFHLDPVFAARVQRTYHVEPELLIRIIRSFTTETPMVDLALSTGLSHLVLNRIYCLKWRSALTNTLPAAKPNRRSKSALRTSVAQVQEPLSVDLIDRIITLISLHIRSADISSWLGITLMQVREVKGLARASRRAVVLRGDKSPTT